MVVTLNDLDSTIVLEQPGGKEEEFYTFHPYGFLLF